MPDSPLLALEGLRLRTSAGREPLFDDVALELAPGERLLIEGPSGAGKSSLLRCLALLDARSEGQLRFRGEAVHGGHVPAFRRRVIYLAQQPPPFSLTVGGSIERAQSFRAATASDWRDRARAIAGDLGLEDDVLDRRLPSLSGGEGQRVALLRALLLEPKVLLLDEPTSALDEEAATRVGEAVDSWAGPDRALVVVSHQAHPWRQLTTRTLAIGADHRIVDVAEASP